MIFRKKKDLRRAEPMPKHQFRRICRSLRRHGVFVWIGDEADKICSSRNVEAITFNDNTVVFRHNPSRSVVFEELIHLHQYSVKRCDGTRLSRIQCEIEAKEKLLRCAKSYQLTDLDISITKAVLEQDYSDLEEYLKGGH